MNRGKSLRQLAKELGVSASYLSQVRHGKCPPSERLLSMLSENEVNSALGRTSNPLMGTSSVHGGFDTHSLPPETRVNQFLPPFAQRRPFR